MLTIDQAAVCERAICRFGERHQMVKAVEEMSELTKEICKRLTDPSKSSDHDAMVDEIADVAIMVQQMASMVGYHYVQKRIGVKLNRLSDLIEKRNG